MNSTIEDIWLWCD